MSHQRKTYFMEQSLFVTSVMSKINLPKTKLENDLNRHDRFSPDDAGFVDNLPGYENLSCRSVFTPVYGDVEIVFVNRPENKIIYIDVPVTTGFWVTCTKRNDERSYKFAFGVSLS